uniref:Uncharacterized protein n=1 Tax=Brassica campestris TaxID=3711 RepID=M4E0M6_BRACM
MENQWTSGLCSCMEDGKTVCLTCFCPCVAFGRIANIADEGNHGCGECGIFYGLICCVVGLPCLFSCTYRTKIRRKFGLPESPASDCITHCFCESCALCQEYRELKNRGLDPSIGNCNSYEPFSQGREYKSYYSYTKSSVFFIFLFSLFFVKEFHRALFICF